MLYALLALMIFAASPSDDNFWQDWERENELRYPPADMKLLHGIYLYGTSTGIPPRNKEGFLDYADKYLNRLRMDSLVEKENSERRSKYLKIKKRLFSGMHHEKDKFGQYDYWEILGVTVTGKSHTDMIISDKNGMNDVARLFVETRKKSCMDENAKILFLLENNKIVSLESESPFNCKSAFFTRYIKDGEIDAKVKSVRIDAGTNGTFQEEFDLTDELKNSFDLYLQNARWIQEDIYQ